MPQMWDCLSTLAKFAIFWPRWEEFHGLFAHCVKATFPSTASTGIPSLCALPGGKEQGFLGLSALLAKRPGFGATRKVRVALETDTEQQQPAKIKVTNPGCSCQKILAGEGSSKGWRMQKSLGKGVSSPFSHSLPWRRIQESLGKELCGIVSQRVSVCTALPFLLHQPLRSC